MKTTSIRNRSLKAIAGTALAVAISTSEVTRAADQLAWDKTFPQSDKVIHQKVSFHNRLGINLVADLYIPKNIDRSKKHPAIVVGGPYGAVKEQSSGLYAQTMAERGFVTIAHDPYYNGESGNRLVLASEVGLGAFLDRVGNHAHGRSARAAGQHPPGEPHRENERTNTRTDDDPEKAGQRCRHVVSERVRRFAVDISGGSYCCAGGYGSDLAQKRHPAMRCRTCCE